MAEPRFEGGGVFDSAPPPARPVATIVTPKIIQAATRMRIIGRAGPHDSLDGFMFSNVKSNHPSILFDYILKVFPNPDNGHVVLLSLFSS